MTSPQPKLMHQPAAKPAALSRDFRSSDPETPIPKRHAVVTPPRSFCWQNGFILLEPPGFCCSWNKPLHLSVEQNPVPCYLSNLSFDDVPKMYFLLRPMSNHYMNHELTSSIDNLKILNDFHVRNVHCCSGASRNSHVGKHRFFANFNAGDYMV